MEDEVLCLMFHDCDCLHLMPVGVMDLSAGFVKNLGVKSTNSLTIEHENKINGYSLYMHIKLYV